MDIRPQPVQEAALRSRAKIVLFGGSKGGGKSFALRLAPLYYIDRHGYHAVIFRRTLPQCKKPGGLWDKSFEVYPYLGAYPRVSELKWIFPSGATIQFSHLQQPNSWQDWQGTETALYGFDQLEEFNQDHFLKILGCLRTTCGAPTQILATMNPDGSSWVRSLVAPWIGFDGYVDLDENKSLKYFTVEENQIIWVSSDWRDGNNQPPISIQYISADIWDNPILLESDPSYLSNLMSQSLIDRERFLGQKGRGGNWNIKAEAGVIFRAEWFQRCALIRFQAGDRAVRFWDFAATQKTSGDYTVGLLLIFRGDRFYVSDVVRVRLPPASTNDIVLNTARGDGSAVSVAWQQDPGAAGVRDSANLQRILVGFDARAIPDLRDKVSRAFPVSSGVESGAIAFCTAAWNQALFSEMERFPDGEHDDQVDALSGAFNFLATPVSTLRSYRY
jgi:predicted phage terminase large subunit-like protein